MVSPPEDPRPALEILEIADQFVPHFKSKIYVTPIVDSDTALDLWMASRETLGVDCGWSPIVVLVDEWSEAILEKMPTSLANIGVLGRKSPRALFNRREQRLEANCVDNEPARRNLTNYRRQLEKIAAGDPLPARHRASYTFLSGDAAKEVTKRVLLLPVPPELTAVALGFDADDSLSTAEHAAVHRYWATRWGAVPVYASGNVVELAVDRPPASSVDLAGVVWEQYLYCPDTIKPKRKSGSPSLQRLAADVHRQARWYFEWK